LANLIEQRVEMARNGENPFAICKMEAGWLVIGDVQPLPGYCVFLAEPVIESLNDRINYETLPNAEPALHTEPGDKRRRPAWVGYDWPTSRRFDPAKDGAFVERMRHELSGASV
jgi:hypothetical protein